MGNLKLRDGIVGAGVGIVLIALFYLGEQLLRWPFFPFDLFDWLARVLPGDLVTLGIDATVDFILVFNIGGSTSETAKLIEQLMALLLFVLLWSVIGWVVSAISQRSQLSPQQAGMAVATVFAAGAIAITSNLGSLRGLLGFAWLVILLVGAGWVIGQVLAGAPAAESAESERRNFLLKFGGAVLGITLGAVGLGQLFSQEPSDTGAEQAVDISDGNMEVADVATDPADLQDRLQPAPGTRPEITPDGEFYRIDINTRPPVIMEEDWELQVEGLFDNPRNLTLADLMALPAVT